LPCRCCPHWRDSAACKATSRSVEAFAAALPLRATAPRELRGWARRRERLRLERPALTTPDRHVALVDATAADLYRRARELLRGEQSSLRVYGCKPFAFADLARVPLPRATRDFAWRLLHERLAFRRWMTTANGASMTTCPDCGLAMTAVCNDHITLNCAGGLTPAVRGALSAWLSPLLVRAGGSPTTFADAWAWALRPARRRGYEFVAVMLAAIAKHRLWVHFTARVFGSQATTSMTPEIGDGDDDDEATSLIMQHTPMAGAAAVTVVVERCKSELRSWLRVVKARRPKWFGCVARIARLLR